LKTPLARLRTVGFLEGCSFVLLLGVAMPLKYGPTGIEWPVKVVGAAHGGLWVLMLACVAETAWKRRWPWRRVAVAVLASVVPGGPFVLDRTLKQEQLEAEAAPAAG
jgi:integral membrane protein